MLGFLEGRGVMGKAPPEPERALNWLRNCHISKCDSDRVDPSGSPFCLPQGRSFQAAHKSTAIAQPISWWYRLGGHFSIPEAK